MLGGVLAEVAGPLKDFAEKLGGENGEQWLSAFKRFLRKEEAWPKFPIWKTIELGTGPKTVDDFRKAIKDNGIKISSYADDILGKIAIKKGKTELDLVVLTTAQLTGKEEGGTTAEVFAGAARLGLEKCPAEVGPRLRLKYPDQLNGEWLIIGMEPILDSGGGPCVFCLGRTESDLWLYGYWANPDRFWSPGYLWVFVRPRK